VRPAGATELTHPPTPMLAVLGLPVELVAQLLERAALSNKVQLSLVNGNTAVVLSGEPATLAVLEQKLNQQQMQETTPRSAVPFYKRRPVVTTRFLKVTAPFHFSRMERAEALILADVARIGLRISGDRLAIPVYATDGHARDLGQTCGSSDIMPTLVSMQATRTVQWPASVANASARNSITHVLDFGPGGTRGSATLTRRVLADRMEDLPVILAAPFQPSENDRPEGVFGLDTLMSDTAAHEGAKAHWAAAINKQKMVRRIASAPVLSVASRAGGMRKGQLGSRERKLHELDATKVSVNEFKKLSKSPQATSFKDRQVTFVTD